MRGTGSVRLGGSYCEPRGATQKWQAALNGRGALTGGFERALCSLSQVESSRLLTSGVRLGTRKTYAADRPSAAGPHDCEGGILVLNGGPACRAAGGGRHRWPLS